MKYIFKAIGYYLIQCLLALFVMGGIKKLIDHFGFEIIIYWIISIVLGGSFLLLLVIAVLEKAEELAKENQVKDKNN